MPYNPNNNPYVPGDPYSYDLKWIVDQIKQLISNYTGIYDDLVEYINDYLSNLDLDEQVQAAVQELYNQGYFDPLIQQMITDNKILLVDTDQSGIFTDAEKAIARKNIGATPTRENILDNPFFTVNQRGVTGSSIGSTPAYTVDRWLASQCIYSVSNNGFRLRWDGVNGVNGSIIQRTGRSDLTGKRVTLSAIVDGTLIEASGVCATDRDTINYSIGSLRLYLTYTAAYGYWVRVSNSSLTDVTISSVKLEVGDFSTLATDIAPDYETELEKCRKYFFRAENMTMFGVAISNATSRVQFAHRFAKAPSNAILMNPSVYINGSWHTAGSYSASDLKPDLIMWSVNVSGGIVVAGSAYMVKFDYCEVTADL